ncbi:hypothetical protein VitviT2T_001175 [Vitis vinifera]|uniref:Uncharacterized protein n=1 Tax=Vitis vinifera TaxID=29760 RepID=A0ABY9BEP0_VITVI|nr:hypothetical protein VitviT2T_001175 [Vitis vinifera]
MGSVIQLQSCVGIAARGSRFRKISGEKRRPAPYAERSSGMDDESNNCEMVNSGLEIPNADLSIDGNSMYDDITGNDLLSDYKCGEPSMLFSVADTLNRAITMPGLGKQLRHGKRYRYVSSHDVVHWARSFMPDLKRACKDHYNSVMQLYTEAIDGSYIETKENALIWHYQDADIDFRSCQLDDSGKERAIYYWSKMMLDYETRPALIGRLMRWLIILTEFDIHYVTQKSIRGSIVANHLASLPVFDGRVIDDNFPDEDIVVVTSLSG